MQNPKRKDHPKAWSSIRSMFRRRPLVPGALTVDDLARAFQQERSRTDRNGRPFCMVVFWAKDQPQYDLRPLAEHLRSKMRLYDLLGHLDDEHLAVLLPETPPDGAARFASHALGEFQDTGARPHATIAHEICTYPLIEPGISETDQGQDGGGPTQLEPQPEPTPVGQPMAKEGAAKDLSHAFSQPVSPGRRLVDILVAGTAIVLLSPVYLLAALAIKLTTPGPIIFVQQRAGRGGVPFPFYKFRSMYIDAEARKAALTDKNEHDSGPIFKMKNDPRITPVGKWLRKTSIDELPQLFNVLKGDMTLIGPRPPTLDEVAKYDLWQRKRLDLTGGITCIWQVSGRSEIKFNEWVRMDIEYQRKRSFWFDVKLLMKTLGAVVSGRGAY
ncbi:MAG: sugar transferase [Planctomycetes bacterium]|nr:sugar transferase [Planctomycetota bacterium]MCB9911069.1 sugar transferase [Planctomycetota bacterium]MCB9912171.1 sugar transferase [Planctomycetota bacterium]HPF14264.1 sugar transferase [Planctomycetota bacterium]